MNILNIHTYSISCLASKMVSIWLRNLLFDYLAIQNTSDGECCAAKYHYCLHNNIEIWERHFLPQINSFSKRYYRKTILDDVTVRMLNNSTILYQNLVNKESVKSIHTFHMVNHVFYSLCNLQRLSNCSGCSVLINVWSPNVFRNRLTFAKVVLSQNWTPFTFFA